MASNGESRPGVSKCKTCGEFQYPPRVLCCHCFSDDLEMERVDGKGVVLADTLIHYSLEQEFMETLPNHIGLVRLDAGPILFAELADDVHIGNKVRVCARAVDSGKDRFIASLLV